MINSLLLVLAGFMAWLAYVAITSASPVGWICGFIFITLAVCFLGSAIGGFIKQGEVDDDWRYD